MTDTTEEPSMLTCQEMAERASDQLDGTLSFRQRLAAEMHLAICPNCRAYLRQLRAALGLVKQIGNAPPSAGDEARLLDLFDTAIAGKA